MESCKYFEFSDCFVFFISHCLQVLTMPAELEVYFFILHFCLKSFWNVLNVPFYCCKNSHCTFKCTQMVPPLEAQQQTETVWTCCQNYSLDYWLRLKSCAHFHLLRYLTPVLQASEPREPLMRAFEMDWMWATCLHNEGPLQLSGGPF